MASRNVAVLALLAGSIACQLPFADIVVGNALPPVSIAQGGELFVSKGEASFRAWNSDPADGRVRVIQYLAARLSAGEINQSFSDALEKAEFPPDKVLKVGIINADDSIIGTSLFIQGKLKSEKTKHPNSSIVIDNEGIGKEHWNLQPRGSAIVIVDRAGKVLFFKDGAMNKNEVDNAIKLIFHQINRN